MKELPPQQEQQRFTDTHPLRRSLEQQQTGTRTPKVVIRETPRGIRIVNDLEAKRRYEKFIRDIR